MLHQEPVPPWLGEAYVNVDARNPPSDDPDGSTRIDHIEVCGITN